MYAAGELGVRLDVPYRSLTAARVCSNSAIASSVRPAARWWRSASLAMLSGSICFFAAGAMTQSVTACRAAVRRPFSSRGAFSRDRAVPRREPVLRMFLVGCQCRHPRPVWGQIRTKAPLPDVMPGRFTGAVFVAEEKRLGAGFDAAAGQRRRTCVAGVR
jgi:hypothetical protein